MKFTISYLMRYDRVVEAEDRAAAVAGFRRFLAGYELGKVIALSVLPEGVAAVEAGAVVEGEKKI